MATFTVTNANASGAGSLSQAIDDAGATAGADTIVFDGSVFAAGAGTTISSVPTGLLIAAGNNLTINGDTNGDGDADVTISANNLAQLLEVAPGATVTLNALIFTNGNSFDINAVQDHAAPIVNGGNLTITASTFTGNTANHTQPSGAAGTSHAAVIANLASGTLKVSDSAFTGNTATGQSGKDGLFGQPGLDGGGAAGAILNYGTLTLTRTLISGNSAAGGTGGAGSEETNLDAQGSDGGKGGDAAGAIFNFGSVSGAMGGTNTATGGAGGAGGIDPNGNGSTGAAGASTPGLRNGAGGTGTLTTLTNLGTMGADTKADIASGSYYGLSGKDTLTSIGSNVSLFGGAGKDTLTDYALGIGNKLSGGLGGDTYNIYSSSTLIDEKTGQGGDIVSAAVSFALAADDSIETMRTDFASGINAINLTGNRFSQTITGNNGNNILNGGAGLDEDGLFGLGGNDTYVLGANLQDAVEDTSGIDRITTTIDRNLGNYTAIENLTLLAGVAKIGKGNALDNIIIGNANNNSLSGSSGADTLKGGAGADRLNGGAGGDTLTGGKDSDRFIYTSVTQGGDVITDFGAADYLVFDDAAFGQGVTPRFISRAFGHAAGGTKAQFIFDQSTDQLWFDSNGSATGGAIMMADLNNFDLKVGDIILI